MLGRRLNEYQENQQGHVTVGYVSLRYTILANHYLACYLGVGMTPIVKLNALILA